MVSEISGSGRLHLTSLGGMQPNNGEAENVRMRLGLISPDATWAASSSRIAAESLSSRKRLLIYPEGARRGGADFAVDVYPYYGSDVEATLRAGYAGRLQWKRKKQSPP